MRKLAFLAAILAALVVGSTASATGYGSAVVLQQTQVVTPVLVTPFVPLVQTQVLVQQPVVIEKQVLIQKQAVVVEKQVVKQRAFRSFYGGCR